MILTMKISYFVNVKKFNKEAMQLSMDYGQTWMQQFEIKKINDFDFMLSVTQIITQIFYLYQLNIHGSLLYFRKGWFIFAEYMPIKRQI